mgnify:CR=1 FL=1
MRLDLWQLVSALEAEGDTFALLETLNSGAAGEIALLRDMVGPALTGIGQPLLEEYAQSFEKVSSHIISHICSLTRSALIICA